MGATSHRARSLIYILDVFPADTLNFVYNELREIESAGLPVEIFSLSPTAYCPQEARDYAARTTVLRPVPLGRLLTACGHYLLRRPLPLLRLCWQLPAEDLRGGPRQAARALAHLLFGIYFAYRVRHRPAHIHAHFAFKAATAGLAAARLNGQPFSFTAHGGATVHPPSRFHLRSKIRAADPIVAISDYNRRVLRQLCPGIPDDRMRVNRTGVRIEQFPYRDPPARGDPLRLLCVASLRPIKNHECLLAACGQLARDGIDFRLDLIGRATARRLAHLQRLAAAHQIASRVSFRGVADHTTIARAYGEADLFVLTSLSEGVPVALMEAMATGTPVIAPRVTGVPELVRQEETGLLADPRRPPEFAAQIARAHRDPALRLRLARGARARIEADYDISRNARRLARWFRERLSDPAPEPAPQRDPRGAF
ncbi:MAG: glycosyltransferase [Candidatus Eisenbacteria bacterium]|nr:glycosyltransferase [Candidatus Eisenbacteria bacterium]